MPKGSFSQVLLGFCLTHCSEESQHGLMHLQCYETSSKNTSVQLSVRIESCGSLVTGFCWCSHHRSSKVTAIDDILSTARTKAERAVLKPESAPSASKMS